MHRTIGRRVLGAALGLFGVIAGAGSASAQAVPAASAKAAVSAGAVNLSGQTLASVNRVIQAAEFSTFGGSAAPAASLNSVTSIFSPSIAKEAAWLYRSGWPLYALVDRYSAGAELSAEETCLATAVYFEARGESLDGQLAVARVVMNRAASGKYPPTYCETVRQPWQFSFVLRNGQFPSVDPGSDAWRRAQAIARIAVSNAVPSLSSDVLWYHANYVAPTWGRRLTRVSQIGSHIFYRA